MLLDLPKGPYSQLLPIAVVDIHHGDRLAAGECAGYPHVHVGSLLMQPAGQHQQTAKRIQSRVGYCKISLVIFSVLGFFAIAHSGYLLSTR